MATTPTVMQAEVVKDVMDHTIVACVLAGGTGTRLYPASRSDRPKQFLSFADEPSLLERTVERTGFADETLIAAPGEFEEAIKTLAPEADYLEEPESKDTGPALVHAAWAAKRRYENPLLVFLPVDHHIEDDEQFTATVEDAIAVAAETDRLVTLGVEPDRPATTYGYVVPETTAETAPIERFAEKPDRETAKRLVDEGALWNAGIFVWTVERFLTEIETTSLADLSGQIETGAVTTGYDHVEPISIDYALMQQTDRAQVVRLEVGWTDVGTWPAAARAFGEETDAGNVTIGETTLRTVATTDNVVAAPDRHVSLVGVDELVVAADDDRILVAPRDDAEGLRTLVDRLRDHGEF